MLRSPRKPAVSREQYILESLQRAFPSGTYIEGGEGVPVAPGPSRERTDPNSTGTRYITIIGGQKYDKDAVLHQISKFFLPLVVGSGRGVESDISKWCKAETTVIPVDPDRYGKSARKANVEEVLCYAIDSPLLLVGNGERVKQARAWLERTKSQREVVELP